MQKGGKGLTLEEPTTRTKGFSLVEMIMVVLFIGILAAIAVPRLNLAVITKYKAEAAAKKIVTALRHTRRLAISDAANNTQGFRLEVVDLDPETGIDIVNIDTAATVASFVIDQEMTVDYTHGEFDFGPLGNLTTDCTEITVTAEGKTFTITIIKATGTVKCEES